MGFGFPEERKERRRTESCGDLVGATIGEGRKEEVKWKGLL